MASVQSKCSTHGNSPKPLIFDWLLGHFSFSHIFCNTVIGIQLIAVCCIFRVFTNNGGIPLHPLVNIIEQGNRTGIIQTPKKATWKDAKVKGVNNESVQSLVKKGKREKGAT